uniref:Uncharacterized protein n=1 Tax=Nelumbo nucifera TaxID=4432 RepID=A0A822ZY33_NELNU|nr:TPA_asm: hypothetical protein HUJ06_016765 [Nelumbo nucifera]
MPTTRNQSQEERIDQMMPTQPRKEVDQEGSSSGGLQLNDTFNLRSPKLVFPMYSGDDPSPWIYRAERYFDVHEIPVGQRVQIASIHLDGEASLCYQWYRRSHPQLS